MESIYKLEIIKTNKTLTTEEQNSFRLKLKYLLSIDGIESICLEAKELFVEFNPITFNLESFKQDLIHADFPLNREAVLI